jgi:hypothetical protein
VCSPDTLVSHRGPREIMDEIATPDAESAEALASVRGLLSNVKGA